jgi:hypothetical protein
VENINRLADVRRGRAPHDAGMTEQRTAIDTGTDTAALRRPSEPPTSARFRHAGPAAGLAGLVLFAAGSLLAGLPGPSTGVATVITHLTADRGAVLAGILLMFLALPGLLVFLGYLRNLLAGRVRRGDRAAAVDALGRGPVRGRARRGPPDPPGLAEAVRRGPPGPARPSWSRSAAPRGAR